MATLTPSQEFGVSAAKRSCPTCQTPLDEPASVKNNSIQAMDAPRVKIILRVKASCPACNIAFDKLLARNARSYWTKKTFQKRAENAPSVAVNRIVLAKRKYIVKFHRGTTLKLRHGGKVSILRVPNRWTRVN